jgi:hypothetical protein
MMNFKQFINENANSEMTGEQVMQYYKEHKTFEGLENLETINEDFICSSNQLISFKGLEKLKTINGNFYCRNINSFKWLKKLETINGNFNCFNTHLTSFKGLENLKTIGVNFWCNNNQLISFEGLEKLEIINGDFDCFNNQLTSFKGLEKLGFIGQIFDCENNQLTSFKGLNKNIEIEEYIIIKNNLIKIGSWIDDYKNYIISKCSFDNHIQELVDYYLDGSLLERNNDLKFFIDNKQYYDQDYIDLINKYRGIDKQEHSEYDDF